MRLDPGSQPRRLIVLRLPQVSRAVLWEKIQKYAHENGLASNLVPQHPDKARSFAFLLRGKGLRIVCHNDAYEPLQPDDYAVAFYGSALFAAPAATLNRFADSFLALVEGDSSIRLISDSGPAK